MLIRIQSSQGTKRIECNPQDSVSSFFDKIREVLGIRDFNLFTDRTHETQIQENVKRATTNLDYYKLKHGSMLYLTHTQKEEATPATQATKIPKTESITASQVTEDEVDRILSKMPGTIARDPREIKCRHGDKGKCLECLPFQSYDAAYLEAHNIKHMSFQAYQRYLTSGVAKDKFVFLEPDSFRIKTTCSSHAPWPKSLCTKCQPGSVTLTRQKYRHVDNVTFENPQLVDRFIHYWRTTGHQRLGFLYGRYETHADMALGIKVSVAAIYEPPQESDAHEIRLSTDPDPRQEVVDYIAKSLGLQKVGWIFTDLEAHPTISGAVKTLRGQDSFLLSAEECILAGHFQNEHPNICRLGRGGKFGSKFATVCVTGDSEGQIHTSGYQVSNQAAAMVADGCLLPTLDAPELGYVRESDHERFVPSVSYSGKNEYGYEVSQPARPFPLEFLLLDVPASMPVDPKFTFSAVENPFSVANRMVEGHLQDFFAFSSYMKRFQDPLQFLEAVSDLHVLSYMATMDVLPLREVLGPLIEAVRTKDLGAAQAWAVGTEQWATVLQLMMQGSEGLGDNAMDVDQGGEVSGWPCTVCTYFNHYTATTCDICGQSPQ